MAAHGRRWRYPRSGRREGYERNAQPDIAWGTSDLFREGAPLAPFFSFMLSSPGFRWFQSPAAGYESPVFAELVANGVHSRMPT